MNSREIPTLLKIIQTDYYSFLSVIFLLILWSVFTISQILQLESPSGVIYIALALSVFAIVVIIWRFQTIQSLFSSGVVTLATITEIWFFRGRGRINYTYSNRGHEFLTGDDVVPTNRTRSLQTADRVTILIDPENPERTVIYDIYFD